MNAPREAVPCLVVVAFLAASSVVSQPVPFSESQAERMLAEAEAAQAAGRFPEARDILIRGHARATRARDSEWQAEFAFRAARMAHDRASQPVAGPHKEQLLRIAATWYGKTLEARPGAGAALNNLAEVHRALGNTGEAERYYRGAVASDDGRRTLYLQNYASWLVERGDWESALPLYRQLAIELPQTGRYHLRLMEHYLGRPEELAGYLWSLEEAGQIRRAQEAALRALEEDAAATPEQKREWLTIFVAALGRENVDPGSFRTSDRGRRLAGLEDDPDVGEGVRQLGILLGGRSWEPESYGWWRQGRRDADPAQGIWPRDAFQRLARRMADWWKHAGRWEWAERCLTMAATLESREVDPASLGDLADLYIERGDREALDGLLDRYEVQMFEGKGNAYRDSYREKILEYHRILGKIYGYVGDRGTPGSPKTARFQLEHARMVADSLENERLAAGEPGPPLFDAELAELLSRQYEKAGLDADAARVRLQTADRYGKIGDSAAVRRLVDPVDKKTLMEHADRYPNLAPYIKKEDPRRRSRAKSKGR